MNFDIYQLTDVKEKQMWDEAIFIFDSSALLDFYFLPKKTREKVFKDIFDEKLKCRLWTPSHVKFEYLKNREKIIRKPINESYKPLKEDILKKIKDSIVQIENKLLDLKNRTKNDDKHPHLSQIEIDEYYKIVKIFKTESNDFEDKINHQISNIEKDINELHENDDVLVAFEKYFQIGRDYKFPEIIEITKEGKHRYEFSIPPGYEDAKAKEKKGTQIFGDLIIWKQILEYSKETKKPIILICNDLKEDWCHLEQGTEKRIKSPREELIKEIYDTAGVEFWMYNQAQFLYKSNELLNAKIDETKINNLSQFISNRNPKKEKLIFECDDCGQRHEYDKKDLDLDFDCVGSSERSMGPENQYEAREDFECECDNTITAIFEVWEYPEGAHNYDSVEIEGGRLIECFDFTVDFHGGSDMCEEWGDDYD